MGFFGELVSALDLYAVLGCSRLSTNEQLLIEYKARVLTCHPDKHPEAEAHFKQLQEAKPILLNLVMRNKYDRWLNSGVRIPFEKWCVINEAGQVFHWVKSTNIRPMIEGTNENIDQPAQTYHGSQKKVHG